MKGKENKMPKDTKEVTGYFQESPHTRSSMRVMCFISLLASIVFGIVTLLVADKAVAPTGLFITVAFLLSAFAPKALQKMVEQKMK